VSGPVTMAGSGGPGGLSVSYLLAAAAGGTGRHVAMLAAGCAARGATVHVYGPAATGAWLARDEGPVPPAGAADPESPGAGAPGAGPPARPESVRPASPGAGAPATTGSAAARAGWDFSVVDVAARPRPGRDGAAVLRLRRLLGRDTPAVLHAQGLRAGALAVLALALPGTPHAALVVTVHNAPPAAGPAAAVYAGLELIVARRADAVLTVSADLDDRMRRRGARLAGRAIVPAPAAAEASPAEVAALRREFLGREFPGRELAGRELAGGASADPEIVLGVGRLAAQKDFGTLIRAAARWQRRAEVPLLLIAGEGPLEPELRRQAGTAGVAVRFLGPRGDVPALLAAADVVVVPSAWEGQPLIVQEAMRAGRPLVATRVGGIPELTGDDGARLVPPGDPEALAVAVTGLLDEPDDRRRLAAAARARAARLPTGAAAVDQVLSLYQRVR
jgi:glycosyltransferase involved in cell wall biosynthesis